MSPQCKVIVLVPPESPASASMSSFPSPSSPYRTSQNGSEQDPPSQQPNSRNIGCLCYPHNVHSGNSAHSTSRPWMDGGSYPGGFPVRMV
ncbi:hypothetical protein N7537_005386 [Penicillium hordei]|uniref:Uncharacterized protein n=1 Tax=Penicillium hordei TaxID=40994 RepID=A0AAD6E5K6_9EURO|nr:uncharacterized protein N7537_005386 [Penicillium hordei]KAJ5602430.1 hypothetical protein N7537_005386 [Penicillium hordei]